MKLLVNAPSGKQEVIEVGEGGGYFDLARVVWDERDDGPLPDITLGGMVRVGGELVFNQARMDEHTEASRPPVPQAVEMWQARLILLQEGLLDEVETYFENIEDQSARRIAKIRFEFSTKVRRASPLVAELAQALGLTNNQVDQLFIAAGAL